jgi:DNA-binding CsgD family transcriptional regulator
MSDDTVAMSPKSFGLTHREREIIAKITAGLSNKEVGQAFSISERTVKHHLTNIFNKVGVSNRLALALFAVNHHLMTAPPQCDTLCSEARDQVHLNGTSHISSAAS